MDVSKGLYVCIKRMDGCILYAHGRNLGQNVKIQRYPKAQLFFNSKSDQNIVKNMFQKNFYLGNVALDLQGSGNNPAEWFFSLSFWFVGSNFYMILEKSVFSGKSSQFGKSGGQIEGIGCKNNFVFKQDGTPALNLNAVQHLF